MAGATLSGLEGVVVADTVLSDVDGERGRLVLRGHDVEALARDHGFTDVCHLLWSGHLPDDSERATLAAALGEGRVWAAAQLPQLQGALARSDGMDALRASVAQLELPAGRTPEVCLTSAVSVFTAAWDRMRRGLPAIAPDPKLSPAEDLARMLGCGADSSVPLRAAQAAALDAYLVTVADHGLNASTFAARVLASTGTDLVSAIVAAIGALKGPLHGGAPGPVLDMLEAIGTPDKAADWLGAELNAKRRIMGMGHRVYRVRDPRAAVLESALERLAKAGLDTPYLALARAVEGAARGLLAKRYPDRPLHANVEFYTAVVLDAVGADRKLFSLLFACSRVAGWCAHVAEQKATGRLIRPASRYVGPAPDGAAA